MLLQPFIQELLYLRDYVPAIDRPQLNLLQLLDQYRSAYPERLQGIFFGVLQDLGQVSAAEVSGKESVAASLGIEGRARASAGSAIVLCHRDDEGRLIHIRASKVGENGVEPDTWYQLNAEGEFVEFDE